MSIVQSLAAFVTDFADEAVILPAAVFVGLALALAGWTRGALVWAGAILGMLSVMLVLKLALGACGPSLGWGRISPSGHTAAAAAFYGSFVAYTIIDRYSRPAAATACALAVVTTIGASRLILGAHTVLEVAIGAVVGGLAALGFVHYAGPMPATRLRLGLTLLPALLIITLLHGFRLPAEAAIRRLAVDVWPLSACR